MSGSEADSLRVLVVDDYTDNLRTMSRLLAVLGCVVLDCAQARDAIARARHFGPQLVLLDLAMPDMDGFALAQELKGQELPPFVLAAMTGNSESEVRLRCAREGFDRFLLKPTPVTEIEQLIELAKRRRKPMGA